MCDVHDTSCEDILCGDKTTAFQHAGNIRRIRLERVKADFSDESLEQVLDVVLAGKGLRYEKNAEFMTIMKAVLPQATEARTITGKVKDTQGNTVPGVSVFIKGTTVGFATDADGLFKLTIT